MELTLGCHVREHGQRVGRLAGLEFEPATRCIRRIIYSHDGDLGPHVMTRPLAQIAVTCRGIEIRDDQPLAPLPAVPDVMPLTRSTRVVKGHAAGRLASVEVDPTDRRLVSVSGRRYWWSARITVPAAELDCSTPGEMRWNRTSHDTRAA
jgi:hypothetical protein